MSILERPLATKETTTAVPISSLHPESVDYLYFHHKSRAMLFNDLMVGEPSLTTKQFYLNHAEILVPHHDYLNEVNTLLIEHFIRLHFQAPKTTLAPLERRRLLRNVTIPSIAEFKAKRALEILELDRAVGENFKEQDKLADFIEEEHEKQFQILRFR